MVLCESAVFQKMRKADLHVHLNGSIPSASFFALARRYHVDLPQRFAAPRDLQILTPERDLQSYLRPWQMFKMLPVGRQCLRDMVDECFRGLSSDNVHYVELRNSPFNIAEINGVSISEAVRWLADAVEESSRVWHIEAGLVLSIERNRLFSMEMAWSLFSAIRENLRRNIIGMDVAGDERFYIDPDVSKVFRAARSDLGMNITIHAGEQGNVENIWWAIRECGAQRIGHGLAARHDKRLLRELARKRICIEVCLESNVLSGQLNDRGEHPVYKEFLEYGVPFVICSDNPAVHNQPLSLEYTRFFEECQDEGVFATMLSCQKEFAFSPDMFSRAEISSDLSPCSSVQDMEYANT